MVQHWISLILSFLKRLFKDIKNNQHLVEGNEELQALVAKFIQYNQEITERALANETK